MLEKLFKSLGIGPQANTPAPQSWELASPVQGEAVALSEVSDPTFGEEILGKGIAIKPTAGRVVSPVNGTVSLIFETGHAVSLMGDNGAEVLVHVGLDTIKLEGRCYTKHVANGDTVKVGDLLMEFDLDAIRAEGYDVITPVVICNTADYKEVTQLASGPVAEGAPVLRLTK